MISPRRRRTDQRDSSKEPDERYVYMRTEDRSPWMLIDFYTRKYKVLIWLFWVIAISAGFGFRTPAQTTDKLQEQIDTLKKQFELRGSAMNQMNLKLDQLIVLSCLDSRMSLRDKQLAGLPCK